MTVASFSARCGLDFCDALWVSRMVRRGCDGPGFYGPAGLMVVARCLMRAASGQAAAKARRMRDAVSITRAPSLMSRRRMVVNSAFASAGLEVSPSGLLQNELIQRQIGNRLAQPAVLELKVHQALHLLGLQPTWRHR